MFIIIHHQLIFKDNMEHQTKKLIIKNELSFLVDNKGKELQSLSTKKLLFDGHIFTAKEFSCDKLIIEIITAVCVYGGNGCILLAKVDGAKAYASFKGAKAHALVKGTHAYAIVEGSHAYADAKDTIAHAIAEGSHAYATTQDAYAYAEIRFSYAYAKGRFSYAYAIGIASKAIC